MPRTHDRPIVVRFVAKGRVLSQFLVAPDGHAVELGYRDPWDPVPFTRVVTLDGHVFVDGVEHPVVDGVVVLDVDQPSTRGTYYVDDQWSAGVVLDALRGDRRRR